jgi:hypothetical protein
MRIAGSSPWKFAAVVAHGGVAVFMAAVLLFPTAASAQAQAPPPPIDQPPPAQKKPAKCKPNSKSTDSCPAKGDAATPPASSSSTPDAPAADKPLGEAFPFPVEDSKHGGDVPSMPTVGVPDPPSSSNVPNSPSPATKPAPSNMPDLPSSSVPDPPASSNAPRNIPPDGIDTGDPSNRGGSSSSGNGDLPPGTSSSKADEDDDIAPTTSSSKAPVKASPLKDMGSHADMSAAHAKLEKTRVADDLKVAKFYLNDHNVQGAYLRYKDAVDHDPEDPDARFGLAEVAAQLNKRDEAVLNYQACLKVDPGGDHDKASRKALQKLGATAEVTAPQAATPQ